MALSFLLIRCLLRILSSFRLYYSTTVYCLRLFSIVFISFKLVILSSDSLIESLGSFAFSLFAVSFFTVRCQFFVCMPLHSVFSYRICYSLTPVRGIWALVSILMHYSIYMVGFWCFCCLQFVCTSVSPQIFPFFVSVLLLLSNVPSLYLVHPVLCPFCFSFHMCFA